MALSVATWQERAWTKALDEQHGEIARVHGKEAADRANYGWGDASSGPRVDVATKVYVEGGAVISSTAEYPSMRIDHTWE